MSLVFVNSLIMGMGSVQEAWLQHKASHRSAEPNAIKINDKLELYSVGNDLPK